MSLETRVKEGMERLATLVKSNKTSIGVLANLSTTEKGNLVLALNEVKSMIEALDPAEINDVTASTTSVYSSTKVVSLINTAVASALEGEDLSDLADAITALSQADAGLVSALATQTFTDPQKAQARTNIGAASAVTLSDLLTSLGNLDRNFVTDIDNIYNA